MWLFEKLKYLSDPEYQHDIIIEKRLYAELKKLGYKFDDSVQFNCYTFKEKDKKVVPIIIQYIDYFEHENHRLAYISSLGVKGFDNATEYLIAQYKKNLPPAYNQYSLNVISQTLARICDLKFLDIYLELLDHDVTIDACYLVQMLGKLKVDKAIPTLLKLLDCVAIIPEEWKGTILEDQKYFVSQSAIEALGKFGMHEYDEYIRKFLNPENISWINFEESKDKKYLLKSTYQAYRKITQKAIS